jgi:4-amino-4-deoxy-L-arabinose transferase-like glycosyltransferase
MCAPFPDESMTSVSATFGRSRVVPGLGLAVATLAVLTVIRLIGLRFSVVDLYFDESQYWAWSREPAFGYYSKPPLLAWIIALAENVCGTSEACIRAPAPILYFATSLIVYAIARHLYDERVAFFAALSTALAPAAVFSARIISTDVPLLFFWALALLAYVKLVAGAGPRWAVVLGVALGLGLLAKYAMVYFLLGAALAAWFDRDARALLRRPEFWLALAIAALLVAPNIHWNLTNGLATFRHTGGNIEGSGIKLNPLRALEFLAAQFAVLGPVLFAVLLGALARIAAPVISRADRLMLAFAIPPLVLITLTAIMTRAFANWAAPAFISGVVVTVALLVRHGAWKWLAASLAIGVAAQAAFLAGDARATSAHLAGFGDVYRRTLGWRALGEESGRLAQRLGARTIVGDQRDDIASLLYYWRDRPEQVLAWPLAPTPGHHFDLTRALTDAAPMPILFVSRCPADGRVQAQFASVRRQGSFAAPTGPTSSRTYFVFLADAPRGPIRPIGPCA